MPTSNNSMKGKTCIVTGATHGIGLVTARELARMGAAVVIVSRDPGLCEATTARIRQETGSPSVEYMAADLSSQAEIRRLAQTFLARQRRLDVLVNNAGAFFLRRQLSVDGIEMTFALDHLNYFLLTHLLLDLLKASAPARIVNVASDSHRGARIDFEDLQGERKYSGFKAYGQAKLGNVLFTYELARRLEGSGVTINALHPGFVATNIGRNNGPLARLAMPLAQLKAITPEEGARTSLYLATSPEVEGVSGKYYTREQAVPSDPTSYDLEAAQRLWKVSSEMVESQHSSSTVQ
jgi:retinol dehydrogenase-12